MGLPCLKNARRIFAIVSTTSIPTSASKNHGSQCGPSVPGSRLEADHPEKGVLFACRFTCKMMGYSRDSFYVLPFFEEHDVKLLRVLTDRGSEFCGNPERHQYELYLAVEDIDHSRTKTKSPQTNGICERFHRTALNEFYRVAFRKKVYRSIDELQPDLDAWIREYNETRPHQGRWCFGKTPMQTFLDAMPMTKEKMIAA